MIGGITTTGNFHYLMLKKTSTETVEQWFKFIATKEDLNGAVIVMDNHAAHHTREISTFCEEQGCYRLFMPPSR